MSLWRALQLTMDIWFMRNYDPSQSSHFYLLTPSLQIDVIFLVDIFVPEFGST